jgi:hypothetical protein
MWAVVVVLVLGITSGAMAGYISAVMGDGPLAYWRFEDGNLGDKLIGQTATDSSVNNHDGTYSVEGSCDGVELVAGVPGIGGLAGSFAGLNDSNGEYVLYDTLGSFGSDIDDNGATFEFWYKDMGTSTYSTRIFGVVNDRPGGIRKTQFSFTLDRVTTGTTELFIRDDDDDTQEIEFDRSVKDIHDGDWHHVAWVIEAGVPLNGLKAYVDGVLMTPTFTDGDPVMNNFADLDKAFTVGCMHDRDGRGPQSHLHDGVIDEFAVYSKALTQAEIQAHIDAIPEPSTLVLALGAVMFLLLPLWRRRR